jgi:hypothetical protein
MGDSDNNVTYTLLRGAQYLKDNRLTPKGFNKVAVPSDVAVQGQAVNDDDFNLGIDEVTYRIPVSVAAGIHVSVSLNYQTIAHGFLQDLYRDDQLEQVQTFKSMYDAQSLKHEQITNAEITVIKNNGDILPAVENIDTNDSDTASGSAGLFVTSWMFISLSLVRLLTGARYKAS